MEDVERYRLSGVGGMSQFLGTFKHFIDQKVFPRVLTLE